MRLSPDQVYRYREQSQEESAPEGEQPVLPAGGTSRRNASGISAESDGTFQRLAVHDRRHVEVVAPQSVVRGTKHVAYKKLATPIDGLIGDSLDPTKALIKRFAEVNATVLITGESGTGKELAARALHAGSNRAGHPFVAINCAALPFQLFESELFGHVKGAFTGAGRAKTGLLAVAHGGTVFLDEIGEMPPELQVKLLRVLEDHVVTPVGGTNGTLVDIRVVAATNRNLGREMKEGRFREDLFYRLDVLGIEMPSLRDRKGDIPALAQHLLEKKVAKIKDKTVPVLTSGAKAALAKHEWRGNVRELENIMERLAVVCDGGSSIDAHHVLSAIHGRMSDLISGSVTSLVFDSGLPSSVVAELASLTTSSGEIPEEGLDFNLAREVFGARLIGAALRRTDGNKKRAAQLIRLNRVTMINKINKIEKDAELSMLLR